jgi:hypothetical protein
MSSKPAPESHDDADEGHDADGEPGYVFTTIAYEYKTGGFPPAGFFCLWDDSSPSSTRSGSSSSPPCR